MVAYLTTLRKPMKKRVAPLLLLLAFPLRAEEPSAPPPYREEIVVTAPKAPVTVEETPSALTVLNAEDIALSGEVTLPDLLQNIGGGFHVYDPTGTGTGAVVDLRGFYSAGETSYTLLSIDGLPVNDLDTDAVDWNLVDLERVERIEILRGPVSTLYGNVGMGGLVNVITHRPGPGPDGTIVLGTGNEGKGEGSLATSWGGERKEAAVSLRRVSLSGFREHSIYHSTQAQSSLRWSPRLPGAPGVPGVPGANSAPRELGLVLSGLYLDSDREIPGALPRGMPSTEAGSPLDEDTGRTWQAGLSLSLPFRGTSHFEANASVRGKDQYRVDTLAFQTLAHGLGTHTGHAEARYRQGFSLAGHGGRLLAGVEGSEGGVDSDYFRLNSEGAVNARIDHAHANRTTLGSFATAEVDLGSALSLSAGVRYDELRGDFDGKVGLPAISQTATSPSLALNWRLGEAGSAFLSANRSFKAPTVEQLYDRRPFIVARGVSAYLSNPALLPQRATNYEAGVRTRLGEHAQTSLSLYSLRVTDEIGFDLSQLRFDNISESRHQGIEWNVTGDLSPGLRPRFSYTYSRAIFDGGPNSGNQINGVPRTQVTAALGWIGYTGRGTGPFGELDLTHVRGQYVDEANLLPLSPYTLVGAVLGVRFEKLSFDVTVRNLFNRRFSPDGFVTLDPNGHPLALYYPGTERTIAARVRIDF